MFNSPLRNIVLCGIEIGIGTPTSTIESNIYTTHVASRHLDWCVLASDAFWLRA